MSQRGSWARRRRALVAGGLALALMGPAGAGLAASPPPVASNGDGSFRYVGAVNIPKGSTVAGTLPVGVDQGLHSLVALDSGANGQVVYQLDTRSLTLTSSMPTKVPAGFVPGSQALDPNSHRLYLGSSCDNICDPGPASAGAGGDPTGTVASVSPAWPLIQVIDITGRYQPARFTFTGADGATPGQSVVGMSSYTYLGHRYLLALLYFSYAQEQGYVSAAGSATRLVALDEDKMVGDPAHAMAWSAPYDVTSCVHPGFDGRNGLFLGVGTTGDFVYFMCRTLSTSAPFSLAFAGPSGAVRIDLGSPDPAKQDPKKFVTEYFPFAADFTYGNTSGDPAHNLLYLLIGGSGLQHFYVFDAAHRSFTGSVPLLFSKRGGANIMGAAADPSTGRAYLVTEDFQAVVTDATAVPVTQGRTPAVAWRSFSDSPPVFDPTTHRLFLAGNHFCDMSSVDDGTCETAASNSRNAASLRVYQDDTPYEPKTDADPDALTHDIPEVAGVTPVDYASFASGYGARLSAIGGAKGTQGKDAYSSILTEVHDNVAGFPSLPDSDRTLYLGQVAGTELSAAAAKADAAPVAVDEGSDADARGLQSYGESQLPADAQKQLTPAKEQSTQGRAEIGPAGCADLGDKPAKQINPTGTAGAYCDNAGLQSGAQSETSPAAPLATPGDASISLGPVGSWTTLTRDKEKGSTASATAIARGLHIQVPGAGSVDIGEVTTTASSAAHGRPGTTVSAFDRTVSDVVISDAQGFAQFACGFTDPGPVALPGAGDPCDPGQLTAQLDAQFPGRLKFSMPEPDTNPSVAKSPGGAKAAVRKSPYVLWNDYNTSHDSTQEVPGLQIQVLNDYNQPSRLVMSLAAVSVESNYKIDVAPPPPPVLPAPSLEVKLVDGSAPPAPLSGATFTLQGPAGTQPLTCLTAADGIGTCKLTKLPPGDYTIAETTPPPGYAPVDDYKLTLAPGQDYKTSFVNLPAIGSVDLTLVAPGDDAAPIPGGVFALHTGKALLETPLATCTTDDKGTCSLEKVPLGDYTMEQVSAPDGFLASDPVEFSLTKPAQVATLHFVDGVPGKAAVPPVFIPGKPAVPPKVIPGKPAVPPKFIPGKPAVPPRTMVLPALAGGGLLQPVGFDTAAGSAPVVASQPSATGPLDLGSGGLGAVSARLAKLVLHSPQQAVLLLFVWLVLGLPVYLWARRRQFITATEGI